MQSAQIKRRGKSIPRAIQATGFIIQHFAFTFMPYSLQQFIQDLNMLPEIDNPEWDVVPGVLPEHGEVIEYAAEEKPLARVMQYFVERYGVERGGDFVFRFLTVKGFLSEHRQSLSDAGVVRANPAGDYNISMPFIAFLLNAFIDPIPPAQFATHPDFNPDDSLNFARVMEHYYAASAAAQE